MNARVIRTLARVGFVGYALVLVTATHWPQLRIEGPVPRPDLFIHVAAFGLWTLMLIATEWLGPWRSGAALLKCVVIALVVAALDELTQGIPGLGRFVAFDDYLANAAGVLLAGFTARLAARLVPAPEPE